VALEQQIQLRKADTKLHPLNAEDTGEVVSRSGGGDRENKHVRIKDVNQSTKAREPSEPIVCSCGAASDGGKEKNQADLLLLAEKEKTIEELFKANRVLQSRCMELEAALGELQASMNASISASRGAMEESKIYLEKYRGLRRDFQELLSKRVHAADRRGVREVNMEAHDLIKDLRKCLDHEIKDKALEAEINNQKLYYTEQVATDWYVERRLLETQLNKLTNKMRERDALDNRIESVICSLANRVKELEEERTMYISK